MNEHAESNFISMRLHDEQTPMTAAKNQYTRIISRELSLTDRSVENTLQLLDNGCTVPFISRYRKERTGNLDEVQIMRISKMYEELSEVTKRKQTIINTITDSGKMTPELERRIDECWNMTELEDIYLPYKPKRKTKAQTAREQGLEPLATIILTQRESDPETVAASFVNADVETPAMAIKGAQYIIAEKVNENEPSRQQIRNAFHRNATITSTVVKQKKESDEAAKYSDYFDYSEPLKRCSSHRLLAIRRGEAEGILRVKIGIDDEECINRIKHHFVRTNNACGKLVAEAVEDSYKRLLEPSIETEFAALSRQKAEDEAIEVFAGNLRQLLLAAPLGPKNVMGVDPGFRTGCKVVCLDRQGNLIHNETIYPHAPKNDRLNARKQIIRMVEEYDVEAIAIGNGTASRETLDFIRDIHLDESIRSFVVSEDGASVYSASQTAREEFPDKDVTVRGAVSIGRRLMDPLAELVKIDPKSIGIGQYQHDVNQKKLKTTLDDVVMSCVNSVGVNLNTASRHLLAYVSGLNMSLANNIVEYRRQNGAFKSRKQLMNVPRLGTATYEQCAGFLRIAGGENPLDNSAVHPESYHIVEKMAKNAGCSVTELINNKDIQKSVDLQQYVTGTVGIPTLKDIMKELDKPGLDPRDTIETFEFDPNVKTIDNLTIGMVLPGIVTNITNFGAFVDIGIHQDGLVHISQISESYITNPSDVLRLHQHVIVRVMDIDMRRKRISLTMKV